MIDDDNIVRSSIADGLAALTPLYPTPQPPFGYGTDLSCAGDVTEALDEVDPFTPLGIGQAVARCWDCPRGALPNDGKDAADYGISLSDYCNKGMREQDLRSLQSRLEAEALKDDRISKIVVKVFIIRAGAIVTLDVQAQITPFDPTIGTFKLVLAVTSADVVIKAIGGAQ